MGFLDFFKRLQVELASPVDRVSDETVLDHIEHYQERWINLHIIQPLNSEMEKILNGRKCLTDERSLPPRGDPRNDNSESFDIPKGAVFWVTNDLKGWYWGGALGETSNGQFIKQPRWDLSNRDFSERDMKQITFLCSANAYRRDRDSLGWGYDPYATLSTPPYSLEKGTLNLRNTNFQKSNLIGAHFEGCDLRGARFDHADLYKSTFIRCDLRDTNFDFARLEFSRFMNCDLSSNISFTGAIAENVNPGYSQIQDWNFPWDYGLPGMEKFIRLGLTDEEVISVQNEHPDGWTDETTRNKKLTHLHYGKSTVTLKEDYRIDPLYYSSRYPKAYFSYSFNEDEEEFGSKFYQVISWNNAGGNLKVCPKRRPRLSTEKQVLKKYGIDYCISERGAHWWRRDNRVCFTNDEIHELTKLSGRKYPSWISEDQMEYTRNSERFLNPTVHLLPYPPFKDEDRGVGIW